MIKIEKVNVSGLETSIRGMRNPMNSWDKSDSYYENGNIIELGEKDIALMKKLIKAGTDHSKFMRMINVTLDITAPLYWWKEFDTYKVGTVRNSCSTMHKIAAKEKEFTLDDFSHEHLTLLHTEDFPCGKCESIKPLEYTIKFLNAYRQCYIKSTDAEWKKRYWWQLIQLLPSSYNQKATVQLNYAVLRNVYHSRKNHKLDEWREFCDWIGTLPYSELIKGE